MVVTWWIVAFLRSEVSDSDRCPDDIVSVNKYYIM